MASWRLPPSPRVRLGDGGDVYDALDRFAERIENGGRVSRAIAGAVLVLFVIGVIWSAQSLARTTREQHFLQATAHVFPKSLSHDDRLAAGYHACHWLQAQDATTLTRRYANDFVLARAEVIFASNDTSPLAAPAVSDAAWRILCRTEAADKVGGFGGDD